MLKYHIIQYMAIASTKLVCIKQKIPHFAYKVPRVERRASAKQGFFFVKSREEPSTGDAALYKGRSLSNLKASPAWYALQVGERETKLRKLCARADRSLRPNHTNNSLGELPVNIIPQFVQKEKPAGKRSSAGSLYTFLRSVCTLLRAYK